MKSSFKIISTLGPASRNRRFLAACREISQLHFRLNGSHLPPEELPRLISQVRDHPGGSESLFYLDLQGNKVRIGPLPEPMTLPEGGKCQLVPGGPGRPLAIPLPDKHFFDLIAPDTVLYLQDGSIILKTIDRDRNTIHARVLQGGVLRSRAGIQMAGMGLYDDGLPPSQKEQIKIAAQLDIPFLALSFVQNSRQIRNLRDFCREIDYTPGIIAKIELPEALQQHEEIIRHSDEVWFCRGDLGSLIPLKELGFWQDVIIGRAALAQRPVIIAGQLFHHMTRQPQPTRSEVVHFYHLRRQGADGIVLSDETAIGKSPETTVRTVAALI